MNSPVTKKSPCGPQRSGNEIDKHVAHQIRRYRVMRGMTQQDVANRLGLSFQQLQKYEHGTNRVSAARLFALSRVLDVKIEGFFAGVTSNGEPTAGAQEEYPSDVAKMAELACGLSDERLSLALAAVKSIARLERAVQKSESAD